MNLILFFNGWGMDNNSVKHLSVPLNYKLEVINFPYECNHIDFSCYENIIPIGWSFGCYYLTKFILKNNINCKKILAINGNSNIIGSDGINPRMFSLTLEHLTPETLLKFYKNMGIDENFISPKKEFENIKRELLYFKNNFIPLKNIFTHAIIGKNDKIIPALKLRQYYNSLQIQITEVNSSHFLFKDFHSWKEILDLV